MIGKKVSERLGLIGSKDFKYQGFQSEMLSSPGRLLAVMSLPGAAARRAAQAPMPEMDVLRRSATP
jgi:hypothetical protein